MPSPFLLGPKEFRLMDKIQPAEYINDRAETFKQLYGLDPALTAKVISSVYPHRAKRPWTDAELRTQLGMPEVAGVPGLETEKTAVSTYWIHKHLKNYEYNNRASDKAPEAIKRLTDAIQASAGATSEKRRFFRSQADLRASELGGGLYMQHLMDLAAKRSSKPGNTLRNVGLAAGAVALPAAAYGAYRYFNRPKEQEKTAEDWDKIWGLAGDQIDKNRASGLDSRMTIRLGTDNPVINSDKPFAQWIRTKTALLDSISHAFDEYRQQVARDNLRRFPALHTNQPAMMRAQYADPDVTSPVHR